MDPQHLCTAGDGAEKKAARPQRVRIEYCEDSCTSSATGSISGTVSKDPELLKKRAQRFGSISSKYLMVPLRTAVDGAEKKAARAQHIPVTSPGNCCTYATTGSIGGTVPKDPELLKKRAFRFGTMCSKDLIVLKEEEELQKWREHFDRWEKEMTSKKSLE